MSKPREFWIEHKKFIDEWIYEAFTAKELCPNKDITPIHVIEVTAVPSKFDDAWFDEEYKKHVAVGDYMKCLAVARALHQQMSAQVGALDSERKHWKDEYIDLSQKNDAALEKERKDWMFVVDSLQVQKRDRDAKIEKLKAELPKEIQISLTRAMSEREISIEAELATLRQRCDGYEKALKLIAEHHPHCECMDSGGIASEALKAGV